MVVDGVPGEPFDSVHTPAAMSLDGSVVAYAARRGEEQFCVINGTRSKAFRTVGPPVVSLDGSTVAFAAEDESGALVVVGSRGGPRFDWVGDPVLSSDGKRHAYLAGTRERDGEYRCSVVVDGIVRASGERATRPVFSADGRVAAWAIREGGRWTVSAGDRVIPASGTVTSVFLSDDGSRVGCVLEDGHSVSVEAEGNRGPSFDWVGWPSFGGDGRPIYFAARGRIKLLVAGSSAIELGDWIVWDPISSGHRIAFGARIGRELWWRLVTILNEP